MDEDEYKSASDVEVDSDHDDQEAERELGDWFGQLESLKMALDSDGTGTVRRRNKTVVTPKMAMESFRFSFLNNEENQDVNLDAILGELCELESQLNTTQTEISKSLNPPQGTTVGPFKECKDGGNDLIQAELDALAAEITRGLGFHQSTPMHDDFFEHSHSDLSSGFIDAGLDTGETDSAFSENASLPSSESFTSMATVSSSADTSSTGDACSSTTNTNMLTPTCTTLQSDGQIHEVKAVGTVKAHAQVLARLNVIQDELSREPLSPEDQKARLQAEKIRIALEKIKEAKIKKNELLHDTIKTVMMSLDKALICAEADAYYLTDHTYSLHAQAAVYLTLTTNQLFVRAFAKDGSSKSILVDEKMTVGHVCGILADKNHMRLSPDLAVVEHVPEVYMERILEDHDSLVENMVMWTRDSKNKILFEYRTEKYDLFKNPEKYLLLGTSSEKGASLDPNQRQKLLQEFFCGTGVQVPEVEGVLYLKSDGKKAWKKFYFVLRASGLYYNPKGKYSKAPKDLVCLVQFDYIEVYHGLGWKKKYHSPTEYCFALKHPQIQKKTSKYIRYLCAENKAALDLWIMGIRIAKYGKQLWINYEKLQKDVATWDVRETKACIGSSVISEHYDRLLLNREGNLQDSRMSVPEPSTRHSIVTVKNSTLVRNRTLSNTDCDNPDEVVCIEVTPMPQRKSSLSGQNATESPQKAPVKRVSFSNRHCIINADSCEELMQMRHRDSITSASTDSSEESTSSGEGKTLGSSVRGRMKAKLPVTTETTRQISEMCQLAMEGSSNVTCDAIMEERKSLSQSSPVHIEKPLERRKSAPAIHSAGKEVHRHERKPSEGGKPDPRLLSHYQSLPASSSPPLHISKPIVQAPPSPPVQKAIAESHVKKVSTPPVVAHKPSQPVQAPTVPPPTPPTHQKHASPQSSAGQISSPGKKPIFIRADSDTSLRSPAHVSPPTSVVSATPPLVKVQSVPAAPTVLPSPCLPVMCPLPTIPPPLPNSVGTRGPPPPPPPPPAVKPVGKMPVGPIALKSPVSPAPSQTGPSTMTHKKKSSLDNNSGIIRVQNNKESPNKNDLMSPNSQSPLPFLEELAKRSHMHKGQQGPPTAAKPSQALREHAIRSVEQTNSQQFHQSRAGIAKVLEHQQKVPPVANLHGHQRSHSDIKKQTPPPPPKRSESTKLSSETGKPIRTGAVSSNQKQEALYGNMNEPEGIMAIDELPPPPPELLEGLALPEQSAPKKSRPPPPPPKRSKDTHLTHH